MKELFWKQRNREGRRVAVPTNKEERISDACESVSRQVTD